MRHFIFNILLICCAIALFACQADEEATGESVGYLRLEIGANTAGVTKAEEVYNPKVLQVRVLNASGTDAVDPFEYDATATTPEKKVIALPTGTYTVQASSAGFDGKTSGYDKPYYVGSTKATVTKNNEVAAKVVCTLANVKVTVNFDASFKEAFTSATATIKSQEEGKADQLAFTMGGTQSVGYFPVTDLVANIAVKNKSGQSHNQDNEIKDVQARDHYIFNYSVAESGTGSFEISVDAATRTYTYDFTVPTKATLAVSANAWSTFAFLEATVPATTGAAIDPSLIEFQYRLASEKDDEKAWKTVEGTATDAGEGVYKLTLKGLTSATAYQCRVAYNNESSVSSAVDFTTEAQTALPNGGFESWITLDDGKTRSPNASASYLFWDTSNKGANTIGTNNPTKDVSSPLNTKNEAPGEKAAELKSIAVLNRFFAAASLYTGTLIDTDLGTQSADMEFGKSFTSRPIALHGFYQYTPAVINHVDRKPEGVTITQGETMDQCAIFIALATKSFQFNNKKEEEYIDYANDPAIIAYGELPSGDAAKAEDNNGYVEFNIPLKYKSLTEKPTHIIIVCSSSKYGDYMTGGVGSTLYVDDFSLVYGDDPKVQE